MKRCPNCNYENAQANMYCERCGTLLSSPSANTFSEQTYASVNEAYTSPVDSPATTQEPSYYNSSTPYSSTPPPPPPMMQSIYSAPLDGPLSQPPLYNSPPVPGYSYSPPSSFVPQSQPGKRGFGAALLSSLLYLFGALCVAFGAAGLMLHDTSNLLIGIVFIVLCVVALIALVLLLIFRKYLALKGWVRVLITVGLTIVGALALFVAEGISRGSSQYVALGIVIVTYGLITAIVAFW